MTAVAHLLPENAAEATLAVDIVAAQLHARDAVQRFPRPDPGTTIDPERIRRCRAQAASMMRQADSGIRTLLRMQAERQKAEDALRPAAMERVDYWFPIDNNNFNDLVSYNLPDPKHYPQIGFRGLTADGWLWRTDRLTAPNGSVQLQGHNPVPLYRSFDRFHEGRPRSG